MQKYRNYVFDEKDEIRSHSISTPLTYIFTQVARIIPHEKNLDTQSENPTSHLTT